MSPLFSVVVSSFEHESFVKEMAESVLGQTIRNLELIVVDDGSGDSTLEVLRRLAVHDQRMHVLEHPGHENRGLVPSLQLAVAHATGPYFAVLGSDDRWAPDKLERQLPMLQRGAFLCYGRARVIDEQGIAKPGQLTGRPPTDLGLPFLETVLAYNVVPAMTAAFPRHAYEKVGGFDPAEPYEDLGLWLRLALAGPCMFVDRALGDYRVSRKGRMLRDVAVGAEISGVVRTIEVIRDGDHVPEVHVGTVKSWLRCWEAVGALVYDENPDVFLRLRPEDAPRLCALLKEWSSHLLSITDREAREQWAGRISAVGVEFERAAGTMMPLPERRS